VDTEYALVGMRSARKFRMGDKVTIKVVAANQIKRQLDYEWVLSPGSDDKPFAERSKERPKERPKDRPKRKKKKEDKGTDL
jgi:ribonuclease R